MITGLKGRSLDGDDLPRTARLNAYAREISLIHNLN